MKPKLLFSLSLLINTSILFAQDNAKAEQLIQEGIALHDAGKFNDAINKYREALLEDANNTTALYEMSFTFMMLEEYDSCIALSNQLMESKAEDGILKNVYVNLGTCYDYKKESSKSITTYDEGIKKFPDFYLLYFNKGVTYLLSLNDEEKAEASFQKAVALNPKHASSHYWLFKILENKNKIPALLAASRVCILETNTKRSNEAAEFIKQKVVGNIKRDSATNTINIFIPSGSLNEKKENDFGFVDLALSLMAASPEITDTLGFDTDEKKLSFQFQNLCNSLQESKKHKGFYWKYYAPFFYHLNKEGYTDVVTHSILQNSDAEANAWLKEHTTHVENFKNWMENFSWAKE